MEYISIMVGSDGVVFDHGDETSSCIKIRMYWTGEYRPTAYGKFFGSIRVKVVFWIVYLLYFCMLSL